MTKRTQKTAIIITKKSITAAVEIF